VGKQPAIIELNGQKYDAITGNRVTSAPTATSQPRMVDVIAPTRSIERHKTPSHDVHKKTDHSHTLMRHAVKKPSASSDVVHHEVVHHEKPEPVPIHHSHEPKHNHSHTVSKSPHISRFGDTKPSPYVSQMKSLDVSPKQLDVVSAPKHHEPIHHTAVEHKTTSAEELISKSLQSVKVPEKHSTRTRVKLRHRAAKRLNVSNKVINFAAGTAAVLLIGGFFAYQNVPNLAVRYAGLKAGVSATLPGYHPTAFTVSNNVKYSPGQVAVQYSSNTDDRSYTVTQKRTDWTNSELESFMKTQSGKAPQSYESGQQTIYIQNEGDKITAATVEGGVLKNVAGNASLNTDQVIKIVSSM